MRNAGVYLLSVVLIAGTLSAVVSMATVTWLYPKRPLDRTVAAPPVAEAPATPAPTLPVPATATAATPEEQLALDLIRKASAGDLKGAAALADGLPAEALREAITRHSPAPLRVSRLPSPKGRVDVLVWVTIGPKSTRSLYQLTIAGGKVRSVQGPMAPEGGFGLLPLTLLDEQAREMDTARLKGRGLLLVAPRAPEPGLAELLNQLQTTYGPQGVEVALVMDIKSADWAAAARAGGYKGPIWKVKARLDDVPLVKRNTFLGAEGILVDREGYAVASLAALNPHNYALPDENPAAIAASVLRAYGLIQ